MMEDPGPSRGGVPLVHVVLAAVIGGLIVFIATEIRSAVVGLVKDGVAVPPPTFTGPELSREWQWRSKPAEYEQMYRAFDRPQRIDWIRESGR